MQIKVEKNVGCIEGICTRFPGAERYSRVLLQVRRFLSPKHEARIAWNDPEISIEWGVVGNYNGSANVEVYALKDETELKLSEKDQKWEGIKNTVNC